VYVFLQLIPCLLMRLEQELTSRSSMDDIESRVSRSSRTKTK
jgi:hypothetical protein